MSVIVVLVFHEMQGVFGIFKGNLERIKIFEKVLFRTNLLLQKKFH